MIVNYHKRADVYKLITKVCYLALIVIGIGITVLGIAQMMQGTSMRIAILALRFLATAFSAYVTFMNPAVKWQQLRMAALSIESEIWTYRTRAGPYRSSGEVFDNSADRHLHDVLAEIKASVLESADLKSTSFYSHSMSYNLHGQHRPMNSKRTKTTLFHDEEHDGIEDDQMPNVTSTMKHDVEALANRDNGFEMEASSYYNNLRPKSNAASTASPTTANGASTTSGGPSNNVLSRMNSGVSSF